MPIKAIIGLGNPGPKFIHTRHNIGFRLVDALAEQYSAHWKKESNKEIAEITLHGKRVLLVKPQTFMNNSGEVMASLTKRGIKPEEVLVVHDELELPFGQVKTKIGGSAKGHNGLKSIISYIGDLFHRLRIGIGRPDNREDVPDYVLSKFIETEEQIGGILEQAIEIVEDYLVG